MSRTPASILSRPLGAIDHENVHGTGRRFQLQSELLLYGGEERRPIRVVPCGQRDARRRRLVWRPEQFIVVGPGQARAIDDRPPGKAAQVAREVSDRIPAHHQAARIGLRTAHWTIARGWWRRGVLAAGSRRRKCGAIECRRLHLWTQATIRPRHDERIDRQVPGLTTNAELE